MREKSRVRSPLGCCAQRGAAGRLMRRLDKGAVTQFAHRGFQLGLGVHHDGAVPRNGFLQGRTRDQKEAHAVEEHPVDSLPAIAFVPLDPLVISLGSDRESRHLKFTAQLEVNAAYADDVTHLKPRILDVLNGYLRALDVAEFDDSTALVRMRAQLLRRMLIFTQN